MNDVQAEIQELLQEMQHDGHRNNLLEKEDLPIAQYSQRNHSSSRGPGSYTQNFMSIHSRLHGQQPLYFTRPAPTLDTLPQPRESGPFDTYDRALPAETYDRSEQASHNAVQELDRRRRSAGPAGGRFDLDGDIFQCSSSSHFQNVMRPVPRARASLAPFVRMSPNRNISAAPSSPSHMGSSPSVGVSKRRIMHNSGRAEHEASLLASVHASNTSSKAKTELQSTNCGHAPPIVQGIRLISLHDLSDRFRSIFPFPIFNAIQSKCYESVFLSNDNLVVSAPTGSGKTAILEMSICRLISDPGFDQFKIVYMAPTKSLCSERHSDWNSKFALLDLRCAELTGDTNQAQLRDVQHANIIITTPEKWDSMTRKWKDHAKLVQLVKLFLIDEVHILKDTRGATLEAVVSRMKSVGSNVRFLALSATVPNSSDIATWLGKDPNNQHLPAHEERFGEEFRPVKLQKFVYGLSYTGNDFGFERACDRKQVNTRLLPEIVSKYSQRKPMMIFCITRKSTIETAKLLATLWTTGNPRSRYWPGPGPGHRIAVKDLELKNTLSSGVAFHHAGLDGSDRHAIEKGYLEGKIYVICCTSTLAVGVNLPCHLVIIKNTVCYQDSGLKEYADLEIMQMLGRAGRPQFDDSAIAVIITKQEKVQKYEKLVSGEELLESCLHLNLIDHLMAEIGLGTIFDIPSAKRWLGGTYLFIRLGQNPNHYKIDGDALDQSIDDRIERICRRDVALLLHTKLILSDGKLKSTEFGDAMTRYYVKFLTMQAFLRLGPRSKTSEILSALAEAEEFREVRLRGGEKTLFREINKANGLRFPIKVDIALHSHKRNLIIQAELGGVEFPAHEQYVKHRKQYQQDKIIVFSQIHRLVRCVIDCQIHLEDAVAARHALELSRSFAAQVWDNSPYQMKQLPQIGPVAIRKLAIGGINSIEALEMAEAHRIETLVSKNPPFGTKLLASLKDFPKLRVSLKMISKQTKQGQPVNIKIKVDCGFLNERAPTFYHKKPLFVCLLIERSDGHLIEFKRISARLLCNSHNFLISAEITHYTQYISCYIMCDEIAGTMRHAELKPELPSSMFPLQKPRSQEQLPSHPSKTQKPNVDILSFGREKRNIPSLDHSCSDEFLDEIDDQDMIEVVDDMDFIHVDSFDASSISQTPESTTRFRDRVTAELNLTDWIPKQLESGKWECNHKCKDKRACKHLCCREGVDKAPKPPKHSTGSVALSDRPGVKKNEKVANLRLEDKKKLQVDKNAKLRKSMNIEHIDPAKARDLEEYSKTAPWDYRKLHQLHKSVNNGPAAPIISSKQKSFCPEQQRSLPRATSNPEIQPRRSRRSNDYDSASMDEFPSPSAILGMDTKFAGTLPTTLLNQIPDRAAFEGNVSELELKILGDNKIAAQDGHVRIGLADAGLRDHEDVMDYDRRNQGGMCLEELPKSPTAKPNFDETSPLKSDGLLFFSTSSSEKVAPSTEKRKSTYAQETDFLVNESVVKRRKLSKLPSDPILQLSEQIVRPSTAGMDQDKTVAQASVPILQKSGRPRPEWVNEFDPRFIAEYADIVEFI
ncbi:Sec63 [Pseudocyphellaria aurata]|nr:Sec63 [Pseudocyphellaria aurata]